MIPAVTIRNLREDDKKKCALLYKEYRQAPYFEEWPLDASLARVDEISKEKELCFVADKEGEILGFICGLTFSWHDGKRLYIADIIVKENSQRQGLGTRLHHAVEDAAKRIGVQYLYLHSERTSHAHSLYCKKLGYASLPYEVLEKNFHTK